MGAPREKGCAKRKGGAQGERGRAREKEGKAKWRANRKRECKPKTGGQTPNKNAEQNKTGLGRKKKIKTPKKKN